MKPLDYFSKSSLMASTKGESEISERFWNGRFAKKRKERSMATKSQVVSWMGVSLSIVQGLLKEVQKLGGGDEHVRKLATPEGEGLLTELAQKLVGVVRQTFKVVVDYGRNLGQMIATGKYDWVNESITQENFPVTGQGKQEREIVLFHFNRLISYDDAIAEMGQAGCEPADIADLLALGEAQPELQRQFPIVALKNVWRDPRGYRFVPYLARSGVGRGLYLRCCGADWSESCRFAAVRNA